MPYYKGNILSSARFFLQKDEFFFSIAKVSHIKRGEWMRRDIVLIQNRNSQVTMLFWPFYYSTYI